MINRSHGRGRQGGWIDRQPEEDDDDDFKEVFVNISAFMAIKMDNPQVVAAIAKIQKETGEMSKNKALGLLLSKHVSISLSAEASTDFGFIQSVFVNEISEYNGDDDKEDQVLWESED